jgi:hypothetical protein
MNSQLQPTNFPLWTEVVGVFCELFSDDSCIYVRISNRLLCFPRESIESDIVRGKLSQELIGRKIGLLRTGERMKPLRMRLIDK